MSIDLNNLNSLKTAKPTAQEQVKKPSGMLPEGEKHEVTMYGLQRLQREMDAQKAEKTRFVEVYSEYQENIRVSNQLQTEILRGVKEGEDIYNLFLKAVKTITAMTDNTVFYNQIEADIIAIHGRGLLEQQPLEMDLKRAQERFKKLNEAALREKDNNSLERIKRAIKAHEAEIKHLENLMGKCV